MARHLTSETPALQRLSEESRHRILRNLKLAEDGRPDRRLLENDAEEVAVKYARDPKIFVGRDHPRPWRPWYRSFADRLGQRAPDLDVLQVGSCRCRQGAGNGTGESRR